MLLISIKWKLTLIEKDRDGHFTFGLFSMLIRILVSAKTPATFVNMTRRVESSMHEMMGEDEEIMMRLRNWEHIQVIGLQILLIATNYGIVLSLQ